MPANERFFTPAPRPATPCSISPATSPRGSPRAGIRQVEDIGLCTYADGGAFFSYRRSVHRTEPDYGRHINAIALAAESRSTDCRREIAPQIRKPRKTVDLQPPPYCQPRCRPCYQNAASERLTALETAMAAE